jgi:hypothetical protein
MFVSKLDEFANWVTEKVPYGRLKVWKELLFKPTDTIKEEGKNVSLARGARDVGVVTFFMILIMLFAVALVGGFVLVLFLVIYAISSKPVTFLNGLLAAVPVAILAAVAILVGGTLLSILRWLAYAALEFILAKILGGVGSYRTQAYLDALEEAGLSCAIMPFALVGFIPVVSTMAAPVNMVIGIYGMYIRYLIVKQVHKLSRNRALLVVLIPPLLFIVALVIFYLLLLFLAGFYKWGG